VPLVYPPWWSACVVVGVEVDLVMVSMSMDMDMHTRSASGIIYSTSFFFKKIISIFFTGQSKKFPPSLLVYFDGIASAVAVGMGEWTAADRRAHLLDDFGNRGGFSKFRCHFFRFYCHE